MELDAVARLPQAIGARQSGESGAHDHDPRPAGRPCGSGEPAERGQPERRGAGLLDEPGTRRPPLVRGNRRDRILDGTCKWCACHDLSFRECSG
jgi:hypothetical protein